MKVAHRIAVLGLVAAACSRAEPDPRLQAAEARAWALVDAEQASLDELREFFEEEPSPLAPERKASEAVQSEGEPNAPLLFGYETRDHQLWMHHGTEADLYTVKAKDGSVLATEIDAATLVRDYPSLHELVSGAVDGIDSGPLIDVIDR